MTLRNTNGKYFTKNIYLAAYLHALEYPVEVKRELNDRFAFWITIDEKLEKIVDEFYSNSATVEPIAYSVSLKSIKGQMYE